MLGISRFFYSNHDCVVRYNPPPKVDLFLFVGEIENMNVRQITFKGDHTTKAVHISDNQDIEKAIEQLQIPHPRSVIVLVGGAGGISW